jgi:transcriptional regulator CtsR
MVESKRGGGGYIRIQRLALPTCQLIQGYIVHNVGQACDQLTAEGIIYQLEEAELITEREGNILRAAVDIHTIALRLPVRDEVRARILNAMLLAVLK